MKAFVSFLIMTLLVCANSNPAFATNPKVGPSGACAAIPRAGPNDFFYCGHQSTGCAGVTYNKRRSSDHWYMHGAKINADNTYFFCCNGTGSSSGKLVRTTSGGKWITSEETVTENLDGGGTCTWTRKTNVCGQIDNEKEKCTVAATGCSGDLVFHEGKCVKPCEEGSGFKKGTNDCIECPTTGTQGVVSGECIQCNAASQFFDPACNKCIAYTSMDQVPSKAHQDCWQCANTKAMYACFKDVIQNGKISTPILLTTVGSGDNAKEMGLCSLSGVVPEGMNENSIPEIPVTTNCPGSENNDGVSSGAAGTMARNFSTATTIEDIMMGAKGGIKDLKGLGSSSYSHRECS